jgi:YD repeat-containing protein
MAYDGASRLISATNALTHTVLYGYDPLGNRTSVVQAIGGVTVTEVFTYDAASRLIAQRDGEGGVTAYTYDDAGRRTAVTDPATGLATTMTYDAAGRLLTVTDPLTHTTRFTYTLADYTRVVTDAEG